MINDIFAQFMVSCFSLKTRIMALLTTEREHKKLKSPTSRDISKASATPGDTTDKEIPPYITTMINTVITCLMTREDNARQHLKEYFEAKLDAVISELSKKVRDNTINLDALNQYSRSENIKIHGIKYNKGEDTHQILKDIAKYCGVDIKDSDISVTHRLMDRPNRDTKIPVTHSLMSKEQMDRPNRDTNIPVLIARVNRRDLKTKLLEGRQNITTNPQCPENLKKAIMYEDLTPLKSRIIYQLRQRKQAFRYVWSKGGRIFALTHEDAARPYIINTPDDLSKVGFSYTEIENIIYNVRA